MSNRSPFPEPQYGFFEQLFATIFVVGYHLFLTIAMMGRK